MLTFNLVKRDKPDKYWVVSDLNNNIIIGYPGNLTKGQAKALADKDPNLKYVRIEVELINNQTHFFGMTGREYYIKF